MPKALKVVLEFLSKGASEVAADAGKVTEAMKKLADAQKAYSGVASLAARNIAAGPARLAQTKTDFAALGTFVGEAGGQLGNFGVAMAEVAVSLAAIKTAGAGAFMFFVGIGKLASSATAEIATAAHSLGLSVDEFEKMNFAASQVGVAGRDIQAAFSNLDQTIRSATTALSTEEFQQAISAGIVQPAAGMTMSFSQAGLEVTQFGKQLQGAQALAGMMGVSFTNLMGTARDTKDVWHDLIVQLSKLPDNALRSKLSFQLFGDAAFKIQGYLDKGAEGIAQFDREFDRLGLGVKGNADKIAVGVNAAFSSLWDKIGSLKNDIGMIFAPDAGRAASGLTEFIVSNEGKIKEFMTYLESSVRPAVEDLYLVLAGRTSEVKSDTIREIATVIQQAAANIEAAVRSIIIPALMAINEAANSVATAINNQFGTHVNGTLVMLGAAFIALGGPIKGLVAVMGAGAFGVMAMVAAVKLLYDGFALAIPAVAKFVELVKGFSAASLMMSPLVWTAGFIALGVAIEGLILYWDKLELTIKKTLSFWKYAIGTVYGAGNTKAAKDAFGEFKDAQGKLSQMSQKGFKEDLADRLKEQAGSLGTFMKDAFRGVDATPFKELTKSLQDAKGPAQEVSSALKEAAGSAKEAGDQLKQTGKGMSTFGAGKVITDKDGKKTYEPGKRVYASAVDEHPGSLRAIRGAEVGVPVPMDQRLPTVMRPSIPGGKGDDWTPLYKERMPEWSGGPDTGGGIWRGAGGKVEVDRIMSAAEALADHVRNLPKLYDAVMGSKGDINASAAAAAGRPADASKGDQAPSPAVQRVEATAEQLAKALDPLPAEVNKIPTAFGEIITGIRGSLADLASAFTQGASKISQAAASISDKGGGAAVPGKAAGGLISGPGTGTSDSVPIWGSAGEYVVRAARVSELGVAFMDMINSNLSLPSLFGRAGFADGGLVTAGGDPGGGRGLTLVLDGRNYSGLSGSSGVVDELERHATMRRISSTTKRASSRIG